MKNWKTTTAAVVGIVAGFVTFSPQWFHPLIVDIAKYVMVGGFAAIGIMGKDASTQPTADEVQKSTLEADAKTKAAGA
jgi:hypothetical protein